MLVHFGLETVALKGSGFTLHIKEGDRVKAGDLIAEADIQLLRENGAQLITPVLVCGGADDRELHVALGEVTAGGDLLTLTKQDKPVAAAGTEHVNEAPRKKRGINFDFLQKLGKVLMTVIAVMPAAGLMISIGKLLAMAGADVAFIASVGSVMENIGWAIIGNLNILFAVSIGGSWAKEKAGGAFAALLAFILINSITGAIFGVTSLFPSSKI